jgi:hypothetical protein
MLTATAGTSGGPPTGHRTQTKSICTSRHMTIITTTTIVHKSMQIPKGRAAILNAFKNKRDTYISRCYRQNKPRVGELVKSNCV